MELVFWIFIFILSVILLIKGADWFVESSEKIALALKISPFIVGVTIVAIGTSFPELASSLAAVFKGENQVVMANIVGSNIANILLIVGLSAVFAKKLIVKRSLIDLDAPLLAASSVLLFLMAKDEKISLFEGILLLFCFLVFFLYTFYHRREEIITPELVEVLPEGVKVTVLPSRVERRKEEIKKEKIEKVTPKTIIFLFLGILALSLGANYVIDSMVKMAEILKVPTSLIAILALAVGTSLPELVVSVKAAIQKKYEISLGNIFGSNVFNVSFIAGVSALFSPLEVDVLTLSAGLPFFLLSAFLFVISGISRRIHAWEGAMYLLIYVLFVYHAFLLI